MRAMDLTRGATLSDSALASRPCRQVDAGSCFQDIFPTLVHWVHSSVERKEGQSVG